MAGFPNARVNPNAAGSSSKRVLWKPASLSIFQFQQSLGPWCPFIFVPKRDGQRFLAKASVFLLVVHIGNGLLLDGHVDMLALSDFCCPKILSRFPGEDGSTKQHKHFFAGDVVAREVFI